MSHLYVATNGLSVWSSSDLGETLLRMSTGTGMYSGSQVWALALHPSSPHVLLAGTNTGIYRLNQEEENWTHITSPMDDAMLVTALAYSPDNAEINFAQGNLQLATGDVAAAKRFYFGALRLDPAHAGAYNNLGVLALEEERWPLAGNFFRHALEHAPNDAKIHYLLARAELKSGDVVGARQEIAQALEDVSDPG